LYPKLNTERLILTGPKFLSVHSPIDHSKLQLFFFEARNLSASTLGNGLFDFKTFLPIKLYSHSMIKTLAPIIAFAILSMSLSATATPGKVNKAGCHASKKEGAHCHPERAEGSGGSDGTQAARDKRLKRECRGGVNAGACKGYAS
jgi:hypothetical protein